MATSSEPESPSRVVYVASVSAFAEAFPDLQISPEAVKAFGARTVYVHDAVFQNTLFESIPEGDEVDPLVEEVLDGLEAFAAEDVDALIPDGGDDGWEWGVHATASHQAVVDAFQKDGFEVRTLVEQNAQ